MGQGLGRGRRGIGRVGCELVANSGYKGIIRGLLGEDKGLGEIVLDFPRVMWYSGGTLRIPVLRGLRIMDRDELRKLVQRIANGYGPEAYRKPRTGIEAQRVESIPQDAKMKSNVDHKALSAIAKALGPERITEAKRDYEPKAQAKVPGRCKKARL